MIIRKLAVIFIALCTLLAGMPEPSFAKEKAKTHKTHKQKKAAKKQKKKWAKERKRSNNYREKKGKHVGEHMLGRQTPKEQKKRRKHHLKPGGGTY